MFAIRAKTPCFAHKFSGFRNEKAFLFFFNSANFVIGAAS
jgi:hypothetical protein